MGTYARHNMLYRHLLHFQENLALAQHSFEISWDCTWFCLKIRIKICWCHVVWSCMKVWQNCKFAAFWTGLFTCMSFSLFKSAVLLKKGVWVVLWVLGMCHCQCGCAWGVLSWSVFWEREGEREGEREKERERCIRIFMKWLHVCMRCTDTRTSCSVFVHVHAYSCMLTRLLVCFFFLFPISLSGDLSTSVKQFIKMLLNA